MADNNSDTIRGMIEKINSYQLCLPSVQRKFIWEPARIEKLFDSIMKDYPISTFLFWNFPKEKDYIFYKFIMNFKQNESINEKEPIPLLIKKALLNFVWKKSYRKLIFVS